jgi:transposase-like protein
MTASVRCPRCAGTAALKSSFCGVGAWRCTGCGGWLTLALAAITA